MVSHGGSGSLLAARASELGLAHVLDAATATPYDVRDAVLEALADGTARSNARQVAAGIAALPGVGSAVALLESIRRRRAPSP